jgi:hypothetical protein
LAASRDQNMRAFESQVHSVFLAVIGAHCRSLCWLELYLSNRQLQRCAAQSCPSQTAISGYAGLLRSLRSNVVGPHTCSCRFPRDVGEQIDGTEKHLPSNTKMACTWLSASKLFAAPMVGAPPDNIRAQRLAKGGVPTSGAGSAQAGQTGQTAATVQPAQPTQPTRLSQSAREVRQNRPAPLGQPHTVCSNPLEMPR